MPTLIIHGNDDKTVPIETAGEQAVKLNDHSRFIVYDGATQGLNITHKEQLNMNFVEFLLNIEHKKIEDEKVK